MPDLEFKQENIEDLARKVGTLEPFFSGQERALLLAIFATASERVARRNRAATLPAADTEHPTPGATTGKQATLKDLQQQLLDAYVAGTDPAQGGFTARIHQPPHG